MRLIGFVGISLLLLIALLCLFSALQGGDWTGVLLMLLLMGMLYFAAVTLWRGRQLERGRNKATRLAAGWGGKSVTSFFRNQILQSREGLILVIGSAASLIVALGMAIDIIPYQGNGNIVLFALWPAISFVSYVKILSPSFNTSLSSTISILVAVLMPFAIAFRLLDWISAVHWPML